MTLKTLWTAALLSLSPAFAFATECQKTCPTGQTWDSATRSCVDQVSS